MQSTASPSTPTSLRDECRIISSWVLNSRNAVTENSSDPPVHHSCALVSRTTEEKNMFERNNTSTEAATDMTGTEEAVQVKFFYQSVHNVFRFCTSAERHPAAVLSRHLSEDSLPTCRMRWRSVPARV